MTSRRYFEPPRTSSISSPINGPGINPFWARRPRYATTLPMVKRTKPLAKEYGLFLVRLKQARVEAGLSRADVAKILGKHRSFVAKCETGERRVDLIEGKQFAKIYGKDLSFFCDY